MANIDVNHSANQVSRSLQINNQAASKAFPQGQNVDFKTLLEQRLQQNQVPQINFSKHAQQRVSDRGIDVSSTALLKLNDAISRAKAKGVSDALILNGDTMFIVNTSSNTVVTALKGSEMKDNVFTNIDGTVIM